jgi:hypothetical protein
MNLQREAVEYAGGDPVKREAFLAAGETILGRVVNEIQAKLEYVIYLYETGGITQTQLDDVPLHAKVAREVITSITH